jgi:hypothetical protein
MLLPNSAAMEVQRLSAQVLAHFGHIVPFEEAAGSRYLAIIALFVNGVKGTSALQISRDLNINPKSSFVLLHKLREAMGAQIHNPDEPELSGTVEVDGAYFGGHIKPENRKGRPQKPSAR